MTTRNPEQEISTDCCQSWRSQPEADAVFFQELWQDLSTPLKNFFGSLLTQYPSGSLRENERKINPTYSNGLKIHQSQLTCPAGDCTLLHPNRKKLLQSEQAGINHMLKHDLNAGGQLLEDESLWATPQNVQSPNYNAFTYAIGERGGLMPDDWLEGNNQISDKGNFEKMLKNYFSPGSPFQIMLASYFDQIDERPFPQNRAFVPSDWANIQSLLHDQSLEHGDLITLTSGLDYITAGRLQKVPETENRLAVKTGMGPLLSLPIPYVAQKAQKSLQGFMSSGSLDNLIIYRPKN